MKIGVFGATIYNHNLGCQALTWSLFVFLEKVSMKSGIEFQYVIFDRSIHKETIEKFSQVCNIDRKRIDVVLGSTPKLYKLQQNNKFLSSVKSCDCIIDITQGDSFTDIYGQKRFLTWTIEKRIVELLRIPLILGPQTYGPFLKEKNRKFAFSVINRSSFIISRDKMSTDYLLKYTDKNVLTGIDVAFLLPYEKQSLNSNGKLNVGINPSGLIWGKYEHTSEKLNLNYKTNYRDYLENLIDYLYRTEKYNLYLIPHVSSDVQVAKWFKNKYSAINVVPMFDSAVDVKNMIASMDCFIGTRMHATIAAMSSGVPVIPVSYSRKFEGLYSTLNYKYYVSLENMETDECLNTTIAYLKDIQNMKDNQTEALKIAEEKLEIMVSGLAEYICRMEG